MAVTTAQVQQAYVAFFNRPADLAGLNYWTSSPAASVANLLDAFSKTPEYTSLYSNMNSTQLVNAVYQNLFGRPVESVDALNYWVGLLDKGTVTLGSIAATVADLAITNKTADGTLVSNKVAAATAFTTSLSTASNATAATAYATANSTGLQAVKNWLAAVTSDATTLTNATSTTTLDSLLSTVKSNVASTGSTFTLTANIDNLTGTSGNDTFIGDNTGTATIQAGDQINGGAGTDTLKLYGTTTLPTISGIENIYVNGSTANLNVASLADVTSVAIDNIAVTDAAPTYTLAATQSLTLQNVTDGDADNTDGVEVNAAASVTAQTLKLNKVGDTATAGIDVNIDINGTGVATLNVEGTGSASRVSVQNTGTAIRTLNISGDAAVEIQANAGANNVGALATVIAITNTAGATVTSSAAPNATTGLTITAAGGADTVTLAQAAGANALTNKVAVDLGAGNDTLAISALTAATDIADGASFKGGDGTDTLKLFDGDIIDATRGKLFSGFETVDVGGAQATANLDLSLLAANNTISTLKLSAANTGAVSVTNLADTAGVLINAATGAALTINQKDSGAGSPDDTITVTYDSKTAIGAQTGATTIADVETVNLKVTSTGTNITHEVTTLVVNNATKVTVDASTAAVDIKNGFSATSLVLLDASASVKDTSIALNDAYTATAGVAVKGGAGVDTLVFTGATTGAAAATDLDFMITGNGGADVITLAAVAGGVDRVVYLAQGDSTYAKFDSITNFDAAAASAQDLLDFKAFGFTGNQQGVKNVTTGVSIAADGSITVASGSMANFFVDTGLSRGVATWDGGADTFVFVDANKDGNFSNADDLVIKLVGVGTSTDITATDIVFA